MRLFCARARFAVVGGLTLGFTLAAGMAPAAVTSTGDVNPIPPAAGGNVASPFRVGNTGVGSMTVTAGTGVTVTGGSAVVGEAAAGIGVVQLTGLNSNLSITAAAADLTIGNAGTGSVTVEQLAKLSMTDDLFLGQDAGSSGDLFVNGFGTIADVGDSLIVGVAGNALLQATNGARIEADDTVLGQLAGSDGRITLSGNATTLAQANSLTVGEAGRGEFQVVSQASARTTNVVVGNVATSTGVAVVTGAGSNWQVTGFMNVGVSGNATLNVLDGGQLTMTGALRLATMVGSESHAVFSGANTLANVGTTVTVGDAGFATLDVRSSARLNSTNVIISDNTTTRGEVLVDGVGSQWKITGTLDVSEPGEAQLAITTGGLVSATGVVRIGANGRLIMSTGRLEAGGTGLTNNGLIQGSGRIVGNAVNAATGKIRLGVGNSMVFANAVTNSGLIDLNGSELESLGALTNNTDMDLRTAIVRTGGAGLDNNSGAQIAITQGTVDLYGNVDNNTGAQIVVGGGATAVFHDTLVNNGQFFVFPDAKVVALENLSFTPTSLLTLQLGPGAEEEQAQFARIETAGDADLGGGLAVTLASGFAPSLGDSFQVLTAAGGVNGTFASRALPSLSPGLTWDLDYAATSLSLSVVAGLAADFNGDGSVNGADLALWKVGFGKSTGAIKSDGDADGDGDADSEDFLAWQRELGRTLGVPAGNGAGAAVPEPTGAALALLGCAAAFRRLR